MDMNIVLTKTETEGPVRPDEAFPMEWVEEKSGQDNLGKYTKGLTFLGFSHKPHPGADLVIRYASFSKEAGHLPGYGSFKKE